MPWPTLVAVPSQIKKHKGVPLTLTQANFWGRIFDRTDNAAIAWSVFTRRYKIKEDRWVLRSNTRTDQRNSKLKLKKAHKPVKQQLPLGIERTYFFALNKLVKDLERLTRERLFPQLKPLTEQAARLRPDSSDIRLDAASTKASTIINGIRIQYLKNNPVNDRRKTAKKTGDQVNKFNKKQTSKVFQSVLGVDVLIREPWLNAKMVDFTTTNVKLITSMSNKYFDQIEGMVLRGINEGTRHEEIRDNIIRQLGAAKNQAKLIARDQVSKFNGQLTKLRQTSVGIKKYRWITAGDTRVRARHRVNEDIGIFSWKTPPPDGHPGQAVQCRCVAEPIFTESFLNEFGRTAEGAAAHNQLLGLPIPVPKPKPKPKPRVKAKPKLPRLSKKWQNEVTEEQLKARVKYAADRGLSLEEFEALADKHIKKLVDGSDVFIRVPEDIVQQILKDGRIKNQFETGITEGVLSNNPRIKIEGKVMGVGETIPHKSRPIYGYLSQEADGGVVSRELGVDGYGRIGIKLKREQTRGRTTFTSYDSWNATNAGSNAVFQAEPLTKPNGKAYDWSGWKTRGNPLDVSTVDTYHYWEAQIHEGISLDDVDKIYFPRTPSVETLKLLKRKKVKWEAP